MSETDNTEGAPVEEQDVVEGAPGESIVINPGEIAEGISGANDTELRLILETLRQSNFPAWDDKIVAGQFQRRIIFTLESRTNPSA